VWAIGAGEFDTGERSQRVWVLQDDTPMMSINIKSEVVVFIMPPILNYTVDSAIWKSVTVITHKSGEVNKVLLRFG
jgi:hypothetical protein